MSIPARKGPFATRPGDADRWIRAPRTGPAAPVHTARLTIDVTPALRARIKVGAFRRGITVADMLRACLEREFPDSPGEDP